MLVAAIDWYSFFFILFAGIACVFAAAVLFTSNIVRMAFYLTLSLGATAGLFFLAGSAFIGAMQLMIYVGGTLVLLVFGVMLTAQTPFVSMKTRSGEWVFSLIAGSGLLLLLLTAAFGVESWKTPAGPANLSLDEAQSATAVGASLSGIRVDRLNNTVDPVLQRGMSGYLLPFVIVSIHLLVVLIGAAYMARTKMAGLSELLVPLSDNAQKQRSTAATVWMLLLLAGDLIALLAVLMNVDWLRSLIADLADAPTWLFAAACLLAVVHAVGIVALFSWQRWGFYCLCATALLSGLAVGFGLGIGFGVAKLLGQVTLIAVLYVLLQHGGDQSAWRQLEPQADARTA
jgi:NADH-quinone oxidoreductase subunit J